jgi:hypothetical protein
MDLNLSQTSHLERRAKPRIICDYPALIKSQDAHKKIITGEARVINLSSGGIYLLIASPVLADAEVHVKIAFPTGSLVWGTSNLATTGVVLRCEPQVNGTFGIAIKFHGYKFL